jgi:hypothetical protein
MIGKREIEMITTLKKMACFLPGMGTPASIYYFFTNASIRPTALKGLFVLLVSVVILALRTILPLPYTLIWLATIYVYWGIVALAGGWGFLTMLVAWRVLEKKILPTKELEAKMPELIPKASVSEIIPEMDANALLEGIERLPPERKEELARKIIQIESLPKKEKDALIRKIAREIK